MALTKLIYSDSNEALVKAAHECGQPMTSLIEYDTGVKSASSNLVSKELLEEYRPKDDKHACIHLIAMGDAETYGFNRNGDAFPQDALEKYAHTFVTNGHVFHEHANKDPEKRLGTIKWAGYDPSKNGMHRVELIIHLDKDRAEEQYQMAKEGKALNFSMSCRVPNDRCSCCGNEAKKTSDYCSHLKYDMGKWVEKSANYSFAYNDKPTFFDISIVKTPADRIARHLEYSFAKSASADNTCISGAELARLEGVDLASLEIDELSMMRKLAKAEEYVASIEDANDPRSFACQQAYPFAMMEKFSKEELKEATEASAGTLFNIMAKKACLLSFPAFCQYITNDVTAPDSPIVKKAAIMLPGIFGDILDGAFGIKPMTEHFKSSSNFMCDCDGNKDGIQNLMDKVEDKFSMEPDKTQKRIIRITITCGCTGKDLQDKLEKNSSYDVADQKCLQLASAYAQYQTRALCDMEEALGHGSVTDNMLDTVAASNRAIIFDRD